MRTRPALTALGCSMVLSWGHVAAEAPPSLQGPDAPVALDGGAESAAAREVVAAQALPLLAPADPGLRQATTLLVGPGWYATTTDLGDVFVTLHAIRATQEHRRLRAEVMASGEPSPLRIYESHSIWSAAFDVDGTAFVVDVECAGGPADPRCTTDTFVRSWVEALLAAGGLQ